jgi:hypothetical protein
MLWFLIGAGLVIAVVAVRDVLRQPDPTAEPDPRTTVPRGGDHTDWARPWDGLGGGGNSGSNGGGSAL